MKKFLGTLNRRSSQPDNALSDGDTPEGSAGRGVGDEVLHLPVLVDAAESSPAAAKQAAVQIRKFLSKDNYMRPHVQYNAFMLIRILSDNPGPTFTRNIDAKFVTVVKELSRSARDPSVQQILRETLDAFEVDKIEDESLGPLLKMWQKEKEAANKTQASTQASNQGQSRNVNRGSSLPPTQHFDQQQNYFARTHKSRSLPVPHELVLRIEEAKTSAKLLLQVVQSTPPGEILGNELISEFAERCQSASRSIQGYMNSQDPPPDEDTLLTLIETNDQLSLASSKHQRALLQARKALSSQTASPAATTPPVGTPAASAAPVSPPIVAPQPRRQTRNPFSDEYRAPSGPPPSSGPLPFGGPPPIKSQTNGQESPSEVPANPIAQKPQTERPQSAYPQTSYLNDYGHPQGSWNPGFNGSPNYTHGQETATQDTTMHGGSPPPIATTNPATTGPDQNRAANPASPNDPRQPVSYDF
ncbi:MAG: hypothetical protein M4579_006584 [Chaenotheca gracillima]|nr:MAG: hypothetical protein M4579_006584 [Chaenotheca gracillima]